KKTLKTTKSEEKTMKLKSLKETVKAHKKKSSAFIIGAVVILGLSANVIIHNTFVEASTGSINNIKWNLNLKPGMDETEIEQIMHEMTHQKVEAEDGLKWGAVPMCNDTITQVYNYVLESD